MSLLTERAANIIGGASQGAYFKHLWVNNTLQLNGPLRLDGSAVSASAPQAILPSLYLKVKVGGTEYESKMYQNTVAP